MTAQVNLPYRPWCLLGAGLLYVLAVHVYAEEASCLTLSREIPSTCYVSGQNLTVNITLTSACTQNVRAMGLEETLPAGWTFVSADGGDLKPSVGSGGTINFAWFMIPAFPYSFSYVVSTPPEQFGAQTISGQVLYRLNGPELSTGIINTPVCNETIECIIIFQLLGDAAVTVECGDTYTDPGATAEDEPHEGCPALNPIVTVNPVNTSVPGVYTITYNVSDAAGNQAEEITRTVIVEDTTPPVLTLLGDAAVTVECGSVYKDAGATAVDACDGSVTANIQVTGSVDTSEPGEYTLTYNVRDAADNAAAPLQRIVTVSDRRPPVISLMGASPMALECGAPFVDPGATAEDACWGDLSSSVQAQIMVNPNQPGQYTVTYSVHDSSGNVAAPVQREVIVSDTIKPVLTLNGPSIVKVRLNEPYTDAGANIMDTCDTAIELAVENPVDTTAVGSYSVVYTATDDSGNTSTATRTVVVEEVCTPVIILTGGDHLTLECCAPFTDPGVEVYCCAEEPVTPEYLIEPQQINTCLPGAYTITYTLNEACGVIAPVMRTVTVVDTAPPVLTLLGDENVTVECGGNYTDAGATAADACAGYLTGAIVADNPVNMSVPGDYAVTYTVSDPSGNAATPITRTVLVQDTIAPIITVTGENPQVIECGGSYVELGAETTDTCDATVHAVSDGAEVVDISVPGSYTVTYSATDAAGNAATGTRVVNVMECVEGQGEGVEEGEGEGPREGEGAGDEGETELCDLCPIQIALVSPLGDIVTPAGVNAEIPLAAVVTFHNEECATHRVRVVYSIDGTPVSVSTDRNNIFSATAVLAEQTAAYTLTASVLDLETNCTAEITREFFVKPGVDDDNNGLLDNPFIQLPGDGDRWQAYSMLSGAGCARAINMISWTNPEGPEVVLTVLRPDDDTQSVTVTAPRGLITPGEQGVLIVSIACDLVSLLGEAEAAKIPSEPMYLAGGGVPFQAGIIVSDDGGVSFHELDTLDMPVTLSLNGLAFSPGMNTTFSGFPSRLTKNEQDRVEITIPEEGAWSSESVDNPEMSVDTLTAQTTHLSVFEAVEEPALGPILSISPNPAYDFIVGIVQVNGSVTNVLKVKNIGGGVLNGAATLNDANSVFNIEGETEYSLAYGQTAIITVTFKPVDADDYTAALTFSNTSNTPTVRTVVTLRGTGTEQPKPFSVFGCAPAPTRGGFISDLLVMTCTLGFLYVASRRLRHPVKPRAHLF